MKNNIFETINLTEEVYSPVDKKNVRQFIFDIPLYLEFQVDSYIDKKIQTTWKDYSWMKPVLLEIHFMKDLYLELRSRIRGKGSKDKKDKLAIDFFRYCFKKLKMSPYKLDDINEVEVITQISLETGMPLIEKRETKKGCYVKPKKQKFYLKK